MRNTRAQIVSTLGPASRDENLIRRMALSGMDVVRLNLSWGTYDEHREYIRKTRGLERNIPIIFDLSGPRIQDEAGHHINPESTEIITEKDLRDLQFGIDEGVEYFALSYVGEAQDILKLKEHIKNYGGEAKVIAKIERDEALENFDEILLVSDAIMIARGDLGNEVPVETIPWYEKELIKKCKLAKKPVIVATQMMTSMMEKPEPTRAEVTDVFFAIENGADAVMLSDETAIGSYPVETVEIMDRVIREAETHYQSELNLL